MAFDWGSKRIGLAVGQPLTGTAEALAPVAARDGQPDWDQLGKRLQEWQPELLLVGIPLDMDGGELSVTPLARKFMNRLQGRFGLPVLGIDERLSTKEARQQLFDYGGYRKLGEHSIDSLAAELLLQQWFNERQPPAGR